MGGAKSLKKFAYMFLSNGALCKRGNVKVYPANEWNISVHKGSL